MRAASPTANRACFTPGDLGRAATRALLAELAVTPKPGLVDLDGNGAHRDLCSARFEASAYALEATFAALARSAADAAPCVALREELGALGRAGERAMLRATGGSNTHRGAIWSVGLLVAATASLGATRGGAAAIAARAGALAALPDRFAGRTRTHGAVVARRYRAGGATAQAAAGFPAVTTIALPALRAGIAGADVLLALIGAVDDTCVLHRGGLAGARFARAGARTTLRWGGSGTPRGRLALRRLGAAFVARNLSPGGCADLLAAALFLSAIDP